MIQRFGTAILVALLLAGVMVETAAAQARGRGMPGGQGPRATVVQRAQPVQRPPVMIGRPRGPIAGPRVVNTRPFAVAPRGPIVGPRVVNTRPFAVARPHARVVIGQPFGGVYSPFWNAPIYSVPAYVAPTYVAPAYVGPTTYAEPVYNSSAHDAATEELAQQVQRLSQEIEQLRQQQALAAAPPPAPVPPPAPGNTSPK